MGLASNCQGIQSATIMRRVAGCSFSKPCQAFGMIYLTVFYSLLKNKSLNSISWRVFMKIWYCDDLSVYLWLKRKKLFLCHEQNCFTGLLIMTKEDTNLLAEINQFKDIFLPLFPFKRYSENHQFPKKNTLVKIIISIYYFMMIS